MSFIRGFLLEEISCALALSHPLSDDRGIFLTKLCIPANLYTDGVLEVVYENANFIRGIQPQHHQPLRGWEIYWPHVIMNIVLPARATVLFRSEGCLVYYVCIFRSFV